MLSTNMVHQSKGQYPNFTWNHFPWYQLLYAAYSCLSPLDLTSSCKNAFAEMVGPLGCDIYQALVVDILHEFELGMFKSVFGHLLRLLHAINPIDGTNLVAALDARYVCFHLSGLPILDHCLLFRFHQIPSFGKGAICCFPPNVSEVRQCATQHFEDVLQVIMYHIIKYVWWTLFCLS